MMVVVLISKVYVGLYELKNIIKFRNMNERFQWLSVQRFFFFLVLTL